MTTDSSHLTGYMLIPIEMNFSVDFRGAAAMADNMIMVGDAGACVLPLAPAHELAAICREHEDIEVSLRDRLAAGESTLDPYPSDYVVRQQYRDLQKR